MPCIYFAHNKEEKLIEFNMKPIGVIHTPFKLQEGMPIQSVRSAADGSIEIFPEFQDGLESVDGLSHLILLYVFHKALNSSELMIKPFLDDTRHGVFSTRWYQRPNPIGLSVVRLLDVKGGILRIQNVDMLDGTPLLDIKPYIPEFDHFTVDQIGWYSSRSHK